MTDNGVCRATPSFARVCLKSYWWTLQSCHLFGGFDLPVIVFLGDTCCNFLFTIVYSGYLRSLCLLYNGPGVARELIYPCTKKYIYNKKNYTTAKIAPSWLAIIRSHGSCHILSNLSYPDLFWVINCLLDPTGRLSPITSSWISQKCVLYLKDGRDGGRGLGEAELLRKPESFTEAITASVSKQLNAGWRDNAGYNACLSLHCHTNSSSGYFHQANLYSETIFSQLCHFFQLSGPSLFLPFGQKRSYYAGSTHFKTLFGVQ